jgi:hypothetical protein
MNDSPAGGKMGEKESGPIRARLSNLSYYAAPASERKFLFLFCSRAGQTSQEAKYYQYVVGTSGDVTALPTQLGLMRANDDFLTIIVITASCKKLITWSSNIYIQISEKT